MSRNFERIPLYAVRTSLPRSLTWKIKGKPCHTCYLTNFPPRLQKMSLGRSYHRPLPIFWRYTGNNLPDCIILQPRR
jgi:hypothetical protein